MTLSLWYRLYARTYQLAYRVAARFLAWRSPRLLEGPGSLEALPALIVGLGIKRILVVSDQGIVRLGLAAPLLQALAGQGLAVALYDRTVANPTLQNVAEAVELYRREGCEALLAIGGGSVLDCAKAAGAQLARPGRSLRQLRGQLTVRRRIPPLFAVPTTAGTGSEATLAAVVSDPERHEKFAINDPALIPVAAVLDPRLCVGLPPALSASTGMDALTHAVEAWIGQSNTRATRADASEAVRLIFAWLPRACAQPTELEARGAMLRASFLAGRAFTRAYIGYVHALAHALGAWYGIPHGLANAVLLPTVLEFYGPAAEGPLASLARAAGLAREGDGQAACAAAFIEAIRRLNAEIGIPLELPQIRVDDLPALVEHAYREANPLYPVPRLLDRFELESLYRAHLPGPGGERSR